jgi:hypothetical protein
MRRHCLMRRQSRCVNWQILTDNFHVQGQESRDLLDREVESTTILGNVRIYVKCLFINVSWRGVTSQKTWILRIYFIIWYPRLLWVWCCLRLLFWILRRKVTPKRWYVCTKLRGVKSQKATPWRRSVLRIFKEIVSFTPIEVCENMLVTAGNICNWVSAFLWHLIPVSPKYTALHPGRQYTFLSPHLIIKTANVF